jgi:hypothetical protein
MRSYTGSKAESMLLRMASSVAGNGLRRRCSSRGPALRSARRRRSSAVRHPAGGSAGSPSLSVTGGSGSKDERGVGCPRLIDRRHDRQHESDADQRDNRPPEVPHGADRFRVRPSAAVQAVGPIAGCSGLRPACFRGRRVGHRVPGHQPAFRGVPTVLQARRIEPFSPWMNPPKAAADFPKKPAHNRTFMPSVIKPDDAAVVAEYQARPSS